jgi:DNA-3-methyladenine glycosylase
MYWQMNISTGPEGEPECVLLRALEPVDGLKEMVRRRSTTHTRNLTSGPGKLCIAMGFTGKNYGEDTVTSKNAWLEDRGDMIPPNKIARGPRIGIDYAGPVWSKKPWRFWIKNNPFVSKK